ncbi:hypothetical protein F4781DRAFT_94068 [Annulohypoxylon bovei var. microspora]|nr:hypothetical protein F4781DRAFT_94068 [Annulohypoxylon bovei var. microspora]
MSNSQDQDQTSTPSREQNDDHTEKPDIVFPTDGKRPYVDKYGITYNFRPADQVCLSATKEGPFYVLEPQSGKYSLSLDGVTATKGGRLFEESELTLYDPFA